MGSKGVRDEPCNLPPFPEVPIRIRNLLMRYGFTNPDQVAGTPDDEIRLATRLSSGTCAIIRRYYPFTGSLHEDMVCPCCGGRGRVQRFDARTSRRYIPQNRQRLSPAEQEVRALQRLEAAERKKETHDERDVPRVHPDTH